MILVCLTILARTICPCCANACVFRNKKREEEEEGKRKIMEKKKKKETAGT